MNWQSFAFGAAAGIVAFAVYKHFTAKTVIVAA